MLYSIENDILRLKVDDKGAEITSIFHKQTNQEMFWNADPNLWEHHAPILFPWCGNLKNNQYTYNGITYKGGSHGFAKDMCFTVNKCDNTLEFTLNSSEETLLLYPFSFCMTITFTLDTDTVSQAVTIKNTDTKTMSFGLGFHPAFLCPFDSEHKPTDYVLSFDKPQTLLALTGEISEETGLEKTNIFCKSQCEVELSNEMFITTPAIALTGLTTKTISLSEKNSNRKIVIDFEKFPYCVLWSRTRQGMRYICIEPVHSIGEREFHSGRWEDKKSLISIEPQQDFKSTLKMDFIR